MADTEKKVLIEIEAKYSKLADMQKAISQTQQTLDDMVKTMGEEVKISEDYQRGLTELKRYQKEYNEQMRIAVKEYDSMDGKVKVVKNSYNDLLNQLNRLKVEWKNAIPHTDEYERITGQVNDIKEKLSGMDHEIGNWQRNVGNYGMEASSSLGLLYRGMKWGANATDSMTSAVRASSTAMKAFAKGNPLIGVLTLLMPLIAKISSELKENNAVLEAGKKLMKAFEPMGAAIAKIAEKIAGTIGKVTEKFVEWLGESKGTFATIISGAVGAGNVIVQRLLMPFRLLIDAAKGLGSIFKDIFTGNFKAIKQDAAEAGKNISEAFVKGYSFKSNFEAGKAAGEAFLAGLGSKKNEAKEVAAEVAAAAEEGLADANKILSDLERREAEREKHKAETRKMWEADAKAAMTEIAEYDKELTDMVNDATDGYIQQVADQAKAQAEAEEDMKTSLKASAGAIADIMDQVAGAMQNDIKARLERGEISEQEAEKEFENVKRLQYANTWINTLSAVVSALAEPELPWVAKAANAATAMATGIANTIKIANTTLGSTQTSSATGQGLQQANAPQVSVQIPEYRTLTTARDEQTLNDRAGNQKVYLVTTELEAHEQGRKVALAESTF